MQTRILSLYSSKKASGHTAPDKILDDAFLEEPEAKFQIVCGDRVFYVERAILKDAPYFSSMLSNSWKETNANAIEFLDDDPFVLRAFLSYIYGINYEDIRSTLVFSLSDTESIEPVVVGNSARGGLSYSTTRFGILHQLLNLNRGQEIWQTSLLRDCLHIAPFPLYRYQIGILQRDLQLYIMGDKYSQLDLKAVAKKDIVNTPLIVGTDGFFEIVRVALNGLPVTDPLVNEYFAGAVALCAAGSEDIERAVDLLEEFADLGDIVFKYVDTSLRCRPFPKKLSLS